MGCYGKPERREGDGTAPQALDDERYLLGGIFANPANYEAAAGLVRAADFASPSHALIFEKISELRARAEPVMFESVAHALKQADRLHTLGGERLNGEPVNGLSYLNHVACMTPWHPTIEPHAREVARCSRARQLLDEFDRLRAEVYSGNVDVARFIEDAPARIAAVAGRPAESGLRITGTADVFAPLPPLQALIADLDICPGAPAIVAGYGYSGKTLSLQSAAISLAAGLPIWGRLSAPLQPIRVLHVDGEQGRRLTFERYQRLARGMGVSLADLGNRLSAIVMPDQQLDSPGAADIYARTLDGFGFVFLDSLRALAPSADENNSEVRRYIDLLDRVSEKTGTAIVMIHHARKPAKDHSGGAKMNLRGSGALFDACSSVLMFAGEKGKPVLVQHEKARNTGAPHSDFYLEPQDVIGDDGDPRWGLRVVMREANELQLTSKDAYVDVMKRVEAVVREYPDLGKEAIRERAKGKGTTVSAALEELVARGRICNLGTDRRPQYRGA